MYIYIYIGPIYTLICKSVSSRNPDSGWDNKTQIGNHNDMSHLCFLSICDLSLYACTCSKYRSSAWSLVFRLFPCIRSILCWLFAPWHAVGPWVNATSSFSYGTYAYMTSSVHTIHMCRKWLRIRQASIEVTMSSPNYAKNRDGNGWQFWHWGRFQPIYESLNVWRTKQESRDNTGLYMR
jgi:hypothetical protein